MLEQCPSSFRAVHFHNDDSDASLATPQAAARPGAEEADGGARQEADSETGRDEEQRLHVQRGRGGEARTPRDFCRNV